MPLTKVSFSVIQVANNVTSTTVGNTTSIPSFTFDQNGVITSASNTAISGAGITANTVANSAFQTGSVENYMRGANLDFGMRNRIINGAMVIDQRNAGAAITPTDGQYVVDRFNIRLTQTAKLTAQQDSSANTVAGFTSSLKVTSSSAYSVTSSDNFNIVQIIEGYNIADLRWGTASARPVTLSFLVRSSLTGTFGGSLTNSALDRSYPFNYTISAANTWEQKSITITGDTTGTWLTTNGQGIRLWFGLGVGTDLSGTAGAWAATQYVSATGATSVVGTNGATWYVTGVQLEEGSQATPFEYRHFGTELALCQRYYWELNPANGNSTPFNLLWYTSSARFAITCPVPMRATPAITTTGSATGFFFTTVDDVTYTNMTLAGASGEQGRSVTAVNISGSMSTTAGGGVMYIQNSRRFQVSAEL